MLCLSHPTIGIPSSIPDDTAPMTPPHAPNGNAHLSRAPELHLEHANCRQHFSIETYVLSVFAEDGGWHRAWRRLLHQTAGECTIWQPYGIDPC